MTDRVYPSAKPNGAAQPLKPPSSAVPINPPPSSFHAPKSHLHNPARLPYRPTTNRYRRRRGCTRRRCFCLCCSWSVVFVTVILLLAAIAGSVVYVLYRPQRPAFSVSALRISQFNLSTASADDTTRLTAKLSITLSTKNTNKKLVFIYDPIAIAAVSGQTQIGNGSFSGGFVSSPNNITVIHASLSTTAQLLDADSVSSLRSDLGRKSGLPLTVFLDTKVVVKMDGLKSKKVGIRVTCNGIRGSIPRGKSPAIANTNNAACKVDLRLKIWKLSI